LIDKERVFVEMISIDQDSRSWFHHS